LPPNLTAIYKGGGQLEEMPSGGEMILKLDGTRGALCVWVSAAVAQGTLGVSSTSRWTRSVVRRPHKLAQAELSEMLQGADAASLPGEPTGNI
jgi:hypothetical protein